MSDLLARLQTADPSIQECASIIARQVVGQLTRLVDDLRDVSSIRRGQINLQLTPVELTSVAQAIEAVEPLMREK